MEYVLSIESAEEAFKGLVDYFEIVEEEFGDDEKKLFDMSKTRIIRALRLGRLDLSALPDITQTLRSPPGEVKTITYKEIRGTAKLATKSKGANDLYGKIYAVLGSMSNLGEAAIMQLKSVDLSLAESIGYIFLQL
jgi:hypothetical protein